MRQKHANKRLNTRFMTIIALILGVSILSVSLAGIAAGWFSQVDAADLTTSEIQDDGLIDVYLKSLGEPSALGMTLDGVYTVENDAGFRFARGTEISVAAEGDELYLTCAGLTVNMGQAFTLTRQRAEEGAANGLYIHESEKDTLYEGDLALRASGGVISCVLTIQIENYLYGVVPYEMSDSFPIEALKAQAIAARTYAMRAKWNSGTKKYDLVDTTADQVYKGLDARYTQAIAAVDATRGIVGMYAGGFAACYYTGSNGGQTMLPGDVWGGGGDYSYYSVTDDPYDVENTASVVKSTDVDAVNFDRTNAIYTALMNYLPEQLLAMGYSDEAGDYDITRITGIALADPKYRDEVRVYENMQFTFTVSARRIIETQATVLPTAEPTPAPTQTPLPGETPAATQIPLWNSAATTTPVPQPIYTTLYSLADQAEIATPFTAKLNLYDLVKDALGLDIGSTNYELFTVSPTTDAAGAVVSFHIDARRFGHGVGMSQRGAEWMAGHYNKTYAEILNFYYPGMTMARIEWQETKLAAIEELPASVGLARAKPTPIPTQAPLPALAGENEYYAQVSLATASSTLNVRQSPSTNARIVGTLAHNNRVIVDTAADADGWVHIRTSELDGYAKLEYLQKE